MTGTHANRKYCDNSCKLLQFRLRKSKPNQKSVIDNIFSTMWHLAIEHGFLYGNVLLAGSNKKEIAKLAPPETDTSESLEKTYDLALGNINISQSASINTALDTLKPNAILVFLIKADKPANTWMQTGNTKQKQEIIQKAELIKAYSLPNKLEDIVILRKK